MGYFSKCKATFAHLAMLCTASQRYSYFKLICRARTVNAMLMPATLTDR